MKYVFVIVGVGGTGSLLARDIPKLVLNQEHQILLVDGDRVEAKNMVRQSYQEHDINENKAIALARKINAFYGNRCGVIDKYVTKDEILLKLRKQYPTFLPVLIGCVDNDKTREILEHTFHQLDRCVYIDSANSEYEGNVYVVAKEDGQREGRLRSEVYVLDKDIHPTEKSCEAQAAAGNTQYMVTNLKMAMTIIEHVSSILHGEIKEGVTNVRRFEEVHY